MKAKETPLRLKKFTDQDIPLLTEWLGAEHIKPWFTDPQAWLDEVREREGEYSWGYTTISSVETAGPLAFASTIPIGKAERTGMGIFRWRALTALIILLEKWKI
ncbi:hypothetical protein EUCA11A_42250 [Eubacterium callanderi]|nr:hypothetical protein [Eubacterium callanderi]WPK70028.1 hypothetical protein EUCA2A_42250 [Eubacterium callanderi]WPK74326.1 hypothetical protein EUCA11A_42250 [Eubacterium callanderi]